MKLEDQVVSLELAKRLKELGVRQEALFWWSEHTSPATLWSEDAADRNAIWDADIQYAAFNVAELGEMLPRIEYLMHFYPEGLIRFDLAHTHTGCTAPTEADARAKMLIYLIENKLVSV